MLLVEQVLDVGGGRRSFVSRTQVPLAVIASHRLVCVVEKESPLMKKTRLKEEGAQKERPPVSVCVLWLWVDRPEGSVLL